MLKISYQNKIGSVMMTQENCGKMEEFELTFFQANCLGALCYQYKDEKGTDMVQLVKWFNDLTHLKNCLGLTTQYSDDCLKEAGFHDWKINIEAPKGIYIAKALAKAGHKVELYSEKWK